MLIVPKVPICPKCSLALQVLIFPAAHFPQVRICPKCSLVPNCPKHLPPNAHFPKHSLSQSPHAHLSQTPIFPQIARLPQLPIMPICSGAHFSWCPIFAKAYLPQCPSVSKYPFAPIIDLPWFLFFLECICPKCSFSPNAHLPQCPSVPRCPLFLFLFSCIFILLSRESDQCAMRARLGVASHLSTTPRWGNPAKCLSQRHNK